MGVVTTQRFPSNASWEQYVATTMSSFVNKVLQDDQVFTSLGGGALEPRQHSPPLGNPLQETFSVKDKIEQGMWHVQYFHAPYICNIILVNKQVHHNSARIILAAKNFKPMNGTCESDTQ